VAQPGKTVGVYERPQKRGGLRTALIAAAVLAVAASAAAMYFI
jgi:hypothetical protein